MDQTGNCELPVLTDHLGQGIQEWAKKNLWNLWQHFKFSKGCLPQILLGPFLNTLTYLFLNSVNSVIALDWIRLEYFTSC